jgi:hypothetical protein
MGEKADPWWTNIVFFSSRRSLAQLNSYVDTGLKQLQHQIRMLTGVSTGEEKDGKRGSRRWVGRIRELTATSSEDVNIVLSDLSKRIESGNAVDMCFATSMVEVGLDVPRLALMTVIGQPKSASQYIQVTGRVGRDRNAPGLIVTVLSPSNLRDRSHYESFHTWHERLYASVEPSSVTPFTSRALERSVPTVMMALLRFLGNPIHVAPALKKAWNVSADVLIQRAKILGPKAEANVKNQLSELNRIAFSPEVESYVWDFREGNNTFFVYEMGKPVPPQRVGGAYWFALNSMRSVDADAVVQMAFQRNASDSDAKNPADPIPRQDVEL